MTTLQRPTLPAPAHRSPKRPHPIGPDMTELQLREVSNRRAMDPASLIAMQRTHGNDHVQRMIVQRAPGKGGAKQPATPTNLLSMLEIAGTPYTLFPLESNKMLPDFEQANALGLGSFGTMRRLLTGYENWRKEMAVVHKLEDKGEAALNAAKKDEKAVSKRTEGERNDYRHRMVDKYLEGMDDIRKSAGVMKEKQGAVKDAILNLEKVTFEWEGHKEERKSEKLEADISKVEADLAERRRKVSWILDNVEKLANPSKWVGLATDTLIAAGKDMILDEFSTTPKLEALKQQLGKSKARIKTLDDLAHVKAVELAASQLDHAREALENAKKDVEANFAKIRRNEKGAVGALSDSSSTKGAAGAIQQRGTIMEAALNARPILSTFVSEGSDASKQLLETAKKYMHVRNMVENGTLPDTKLYMDGSTSGSMRENADHNFYEAADVRDWLVGVLKEARQELKLLQGGSFMRGYEEIPAVMQEALE
jgi:hypothetical protein